MTDTSNKKSLAALGLAALGVVYGDIGTSPLYAFEQVFSNGVHSVPINQANILGVLSLFLWSLIMIVSIKYVYFIMRADNHGEGGIVVLMALALSEIQESKKARVWIIILGLLGASFFYGDGVITPAISVLSAVEGLELISPQLKDLVVPVAIAILCILFWSQRKGTGKIGLFFGPVMLLWFVVIGLLGIWNIAAQPIVFRAIDPSYAIEFVTTHGLFSLFALGAVVLCLTGAEALYADMGHFGLKPIRIVWTGLVLPTLLLNYFGQGALLLNHPEALHSLFYLMAPASLQTPLVILATLATVIASQAVISGAFSMTRQAIQLGFLPRMNILQTSAQEIGQIYLPMINTLLAIMVITVFLVFQSSNALGSAYGIAVTGTMLITDFLAFSVAILVWKWQAWRAALGVVCFVLIDLIFFSANSLKIMQGGWLPILLSSLVLVIMTTWNRGRLTLQKLSKIHETSLLDFIKNEVSDAMPRIQGTAIYLVLNAHNTPIALRKTIQHFQSMHEQVIALGINYELVPVVPNESRMNLVRCGKGFVQIQLNCGFMEKISIPAELTAHLPNDLKPKLKPTSYFLNRLLFIQTDTNGMHPWRKALFRFLYRNEQQPMQFFSLTVSDTMMVTIPVTI